MAEKRFDVVVVGNVGVDTNIYLSGGDIDFTVESNFSENIDYVGQAGGYASRGYAQLGNKTAFIGFVGDDHNGRFVRQELGGDGIDTTALFDDPAGTSRSVNFMFRDGRRKNFYDGRGHLRGQLDLEICRDVLAKGRLAHFSIPDWARHLLPVAKEMNLVIACDLQDVVAADDPYRQDFVNYADILFYSGSNQKDPTEPMKRYLQLNPAQIVIVGLGAEGCALGTKDGIQYFEAVSMDEPVIDTNGAGDGLAVGFSSSYVLDGRSLIDSILRGQITARYTCTQKASSSSLITADILDNTFQAKRAAI